MPPIQSVESELSAELLSEPIEGQNLGGATHLGELLGPTASAQPTILAFLRHFG